jgi:hypothetical protein
MTAIARAGRGLLLLGVLLALFGIWYPELRQYSVTSRRPDAAEANRLRTLPADLSFASATRADFDLLLPMSDAEFLAAARNILDGKLSVPGYAMRQLKRLFDPADLTVGTGLEQLGYAGLVVPDVLVRAYQIGGDDRYLIAARDFLLHWARFERRQLLPRGHLWGDHAVANRALVLTRFWSVYRTHPAWSVDHARVILEQVLRTGSMLAADKLFTVRTNHGVMQNVGLLELAVAFPSLPESTEWRAVALRRLDEQLTFYVSDEGVVLEHSAGYHAFGVRLLGFATELLQAAGEPPPVTWARKYRQAAGFERLLLRPDGTLPAFGDTAVFDVRHEALAAREARDCVPESASLFPLSGYAIWWSRTPGESCESRQLVAVWSKFATEAHKHPDEMSVLFWAGTPWWSSVGYWPYDSPARHSALGWTGSNAPHWIGEPPDSERSSRALFAGAEPRLRYLQLERSTGRGRLTRQIMEAAGELWVVIDSTQSPAAEGFEIVWNSFKDVTLESPAEHEYVLRSGRTPWVLTMTVGSSAPLEVKTWRGSDDPLLGWIAGQGDVPETVAVPAIGVRSQPNAITVTAWSVQDARQPRGLDVAIANWVDKSAWTIEVREGDRTLVLSRERLQLSAAIGGSPTPVAVQLAPVEDPAPEREQVNDAYRALDAAYPYFKDLLPWRWLATIAMLGCALAAAVVLWGLQRWLQKAVAARPARLTLACAYGLVLLGFTVCAAWLVFSYLQA